MGACAAQYSQLVEKKKSTTPTGADDAVGATVAGTGVIVGAVVAVGGMGVTVDAVVAVGGIGVGVGAGANAPHALADSATSPKPITNRNDR